MLKEDIQTKPKKKTGGKEIKRKTHDVFYTFVFGTTFYLKNTKQANNCVDVKKKQGTSYSESNVNQNVSTVTSFDDGDNVRW